LHSFSTFFSDLTSRGHILSIFQAESDDIKLKHFGETLYDNIIFFAPATDKLNSISIEEFIEFSNEGGNILFGLNRELSDVVRDLVDSFGINLDKKGSEIMDHFQYESSTDLR
jgi:oligosaccharyltransferase complex subunit beta